MGVWGITQGKHHYSHSAAAELDLCLTVTNLKHVCSSPTVGPGAGNRCCSAVLLFLARENLELITSEEHLVVTVNNNEGKKINCQLCGDDHPLSHCTQLKTVHELLEFLKRSDL